MIEIQRMTTEDAILKCLDDDPKFAGMILNAREGTRITVTVAQKFEVIAVYAKPILREWMNRKLANVTVIDTPEGE